MANSKKLPYGQRLFHQIYDEVPYDWRLSKMDAYFPGTEELGTTNMGILTNPKSTKKARKAAEGVISDITAKHGSLEDLFAANALKSKLNAPGVEGTTNPLKYNLGAIGQAAKAHPLAAAGLGAMGIANIAGLTDDDKIGGQLVGGLGGGIAANLMGANPITALAVGLGGGTLGSLFDKLRAKKELEQQAMYQNQSY